jgi:hypothetical protein
VEVSLKCIQVELDIITEVKRMRLKRLGHMERMSDDTSTTVVHHGLPRRPRAVLEEKALLELLDTV